MDKRIEIRCPICGKKVAEKDKEIKTLGIYFWCNRCKKEIVESCEEKP